MIELNEKVLIGSLVFIIAFLVVMMVVFYEPQTVSQENYVVARQPAETIESCIENFRTDNPDIDPADRSEFEKTFFPGRIRVAFRTDQLKNDMERITGLHRHSIEGTFLFAQASVTVPIGEEIEWACRYREYPEIINAEPLLRISNLPGIENLDDFSL